MTVWGAEADSVLSTAVLPAPGEIPAPGKAKCPPLYFIQSTGVSMDHCLFYSQVESEKRMHTHLF